MKIVILDTIQQVSIGRFVKQSFESLDHDVSWLDVRRFSKKTHVRLRRTFAQIKYRHQQGLDYFSYPSRCEKDLLERLRTYTPDLILVIGNLFPFIQPSVIDEIKQQLAVPVLNWDSDGLNYMDDALKFHYFLKEELFRYDHVFSYSRRMVGHYQRLGLRTVSWLPYAVSRNLKLFAMDRKVHDICFFGLPDLRRQFLLELLSEQDIVVYGHRWELFAKILSPKLQDKLTLTTVLHDDLYPLLKANRIILNINKATAASIDSGVNLLLFDTLAVGGFMLTSHCEELTNLFEVGVHLDSFQTPEEMQTKINFYLKNPGLREHIAKEGYHYAREHHTWRHRADTILEVYRSFSGGSLKHIVTPAEAEVY